MPPSLELESVLCVFLFDSTIGSTDESSSDDYLLTQGKRHVTTCMHEFPRV